MAAAPAPLGWGGILRLALVQASIGAMVVLATSTINRVMVVELALPALLPGLLVALHYAVQAVRPRLGHGADAGGRCAPWIRGGMAVLAVGTCVAAAAVTVLAESRLAGIAVAILGYVLIGLGVGAAGTALLVLLAKRVAPARRPAAATLTWILLIAGFIVSSAVASHALTPYSAARLLHLAFAVSAGAFTLAVLAVAGIEPRSARDPIAADAVAGSAAQAGAGRARPQVAFRQALAQVWAEPVARRFTAFVFVSMLAYSGQELVLEPFCGAVLALDPGHSTRISALQHSGALIGMIGVALATGLLGRTKLRDLRHWIGSGCAGSALILVLLCAAAVARDPTLLRSLVLLLGAANGVFAVAAIGTMMTLAGGSPASPGGQAREGVRMGLWGAAQALAFALGGVLVTGTVDLTRALTGSAPLAYATVFALESILFLTAAALARRVDPRSAAAPATAPLLPHACTDTFAPREA